MKLPTGAIGHRVAASRSFAASISSQRCFARAAPQSIISQSFRRGYADEIRPTAPVVEAPKAKKPKRFRALRWTWRVTYISAIAGVGYLIYGAYDQQHPDDQFQPDPTKQNLVILGMSCIFVFNDLMRI